MSNETTSERFTRGELAAMVGVTNWGNDGGEWLQSVANNWIDEDRVEAAEYGIDLADAMHQAADCAVPIYTGERWAVFVDLAAWQFSEDVAAEYGELPNDMTAAAGVILYWIASQLLHAVEFSFQGGAE